MIKFPKIHIASSVVNRILNVADGLPDPGAATSAQPDVPDTELQSAVLDTKLNQEPTEALSGIDQAPDPGATALGDNLLTTMLKPGR